MSSRLSGRSDLMRWDAAVVFGIALGMRCADAQVVSFASTTNKEFSLRPGELLLWAGGGRGWLLSRLWAGPSALRPPPCTTSIYGTNESPHKVPKTRANPCERAVRTDCPGIGTSWAG